MGNDYWRQKYYKENWTKQIDIALLFQLQTICDEMKGKAKRSGDQDLAKWAAALRLILATVNGEVLNFELNRHQMPGNHREDEPMPDLRILRHLKAAA